MSRIPLPLDNISVASPCHLSWDSMSGDDRTRFCGQCKQQVYDLSGLSRAEATGLIRAEEGGLCVRFYRRKDGTVMTRDCPVGLRGARHVLTAAIGIAAAGCFVLIGLGWTALGGSRGADVGSRRLRDVEPFHTIMEWFDPTAPPVIMGKICVHPPPGSAPPAPPQTDPQPPPEPVPEP